MRRRPRLDKEGRSTWTLRTSNVTAELLTLLVDESFVFILRLLRTMVPLTVAFPAPVERSE